MYFNSTGLDTRLEGHARLTDQIKFKLNAAIENNIHEYSRIVAQLPWLQSLLLSSTYAGATVDLANDQQRSPQIYNLDKRVLTMQEKGLHPRSLSRCTIPPDFGKTINWKGNNKYK